MRKLFYFLCLLFAWGCQNNAQQSTAKEDHAADQDHHHGHANKHMNKRPLEELIANFESPERAEWQKPDSVIAFLGDLKGKTVMDIGSGTGYFSFRLADAGANVICADVDERFLDYIAKRKAEKGLTEAQVETRKVPFDSSKLRESEADLVLIVDTYHHIENRVDYFAEVKRGLKPGGKLVVIDFRKEEMPVGPPVEMKIKEAEVMDELRKAGFTNMQVNNTLLTYQYIITAS